MGKASGTGNDKIWRDALHRAVKRRIAGKGGGVALERLADSVVKEGLGGNVAAIREIGDRLDGKPQQETHATIDQNVSVESARVSELQRFFSEIARPDEPGVLTCRPTRMA